ncbi:hypothetical protein HanPSC8_Chr08g0308731 [Helianthus annuus]|nr:hypothetical protein HanPSC8_Chr08g0308731 [Helianthus annuus]
MEAKKHGELCAFLCHFLPTLLQLVDLQATCFLKSLGQSSTSAGPKRKCSLLKALIKLDFPTPLGPTITEVWSLKLNRRESSPVLVSTLQMIGS